MKLFKRISVILLIMVMILPAIDVFAGETENNILSDEPFTENSYDVETVTDDETVSYYDFSDTEVIGNNIEAEDQTGATDGNVSTNVKTIKISTVEQFLEFAANCVWDSYSKDLSVSLEIDIDLTGVDFDGIPWFQGTFNGNGHTISGININRAGLNTGFIRTVGENGIIKDLKLEGDITATETAENVGGVAGENLGNIIDCSYNGDIRGLTKIGGIAGLNGENGVITSCEFEGAVQGEHQIGGIAGENNGTIALSKNAGSVNVEATVISSEKTENVINSIISDVTEISRDDILDVTDIGGIAGFSNGAVYKCDSSGTVGYQHIGYNVGGICGRSSGYVSASTASNNVYGKNDVGGIVGQLEPSAAWDLSDSNITKLKDSFATFEENVNTLKNTLSATSSEITSSAAALISATTNTETAFAKVLEAAAGNAGDAAAALERTIDNITEDNAREELKKLAQELKNLAPDTSELTKAVAETATAAENFRSTISADRGLYDNATAVIDSLSEFVNTGINTAETLGVSDDNIEDISVREAYNENRGAVDTCKSEADVHGDTGVGGVTGTIDFEVSFDLENELGLSDYLFGNAKYQIFSVIRDCEFNGEIDIKKEKSGGICGNELFGLIINSIATGTINSDGADYVGGIAGFSDASIIKCYSRMNLYGKSYVGGICGQGKNISNCVAYSFVKEGTEILGSVCGDASGTVENNIYVDDGIGGIDGVEFDGKTKAVTYKEMCSNPNVPESFKKIEVTFEKDEETVEIIAVEYGGKVENIPEIPSENGKYWKWNDFENENIRNSFTVKGDWQNGITTISTDEEIPLFLAEGIFDESQELIVTKLDDGSKAEQASYTAEESESSKTASVETGKYKIEITDYEGPALVRIKGTDLEIFEVDGEDQTKLEVTEDGSYSLVNVEIPCTINVRKKAKSMLWIVFVVTGVLVAAAIVVLIVIKRKRKTAALSNKAESEDKNNTGIDDSIAQIPLNDEDLKSENEDKKFTKQDADDNNKKDS